MLIKAIIVLLLLGIAASLAAGLVFLKGDPAGSPRTARALTVRIVLSVLLFALLFYAWSAGLIAPHAIGPGR